MRWLYPTNAKDFLHYCLVFAVLLLSWVPLMVFYGNNTTFTAISAFVIFIIADKTVHKVLGV